MQSQIESAPEIDTDHSISALAHPEGSAAATAALPPEGFDKLELTNSFAGLPAQFYTRLDPTPLPEPYLVGLSPSALDLVGLSATAVASPAGIEIFAGNRPLAGSAAHAAVYSGHQFGVWAGQLGDGRAITLTEINHAQRRWEVQLKGAGLTPYSRMGDGRAVLRSSIREFLCSEAMAALGIPTTRALCVVGSDLPVIRESIETAAVVTRLSPSFIRFGSFEHWFYARRNDELRLLADYVIAQFYPELEGEPNPYQAFLAAITERTARMVAQWQAVGFCHGVMNTDNMSILGLTLDYGPFGFMEAFDSGYICNHSDESGRYAYRVQPQIAHWNLYALGQALLPLIGSVEDTRAALDRFEPIFENAMQAALRAKLGLAATQDHDEELFQDLFTVLEANRVDFTLFFRRLGGFSVASPERDAPIRDLFIDRAAFDAWAVLYRARLTQENSVDEVRRVAMNAVNPKYILRNYLAETAIRRASAGDFSEVGSLLKVLEHPYDEQPEHESYAGLPPDWASALEVSCSS